jgi:RNA polymerase sigma factor (sigma-70 family)
LSIILALRVLPIFSGWGISNVCTIPAKELDLIISNFRALAFLNHNGHGTGDQGRSSSKVLHLHPDHLDDSVLWNAFRAGDDKAFVTIFDRYAQSLHNYGCKILHDREAVRDHVQDLFLELCRKREGLGETNAIKFYLFKALRRKLIRVSLKTPLVFPVAPDLTTPSPEADLIDKQTEEHRRQMLADRLTRLTDRQREAIFLRYYEELSYDKIAEIMDLRKQSIYNLINESFTILKK